MSVCHLSKQSFAGRKWLSVFLAILAALRPARLLANPTGMTVGSGTAVALPTGSQLNITVGPTAILNWQSFNIGAGETTSFLQPSANSVVFNLIGEQNPSQIFGNLNANGTVILANANGFYFGPNSMIKVGGSFIATTAPLAPDWGTGSTWQFTGMPPLASIVNYGKIEVGAGKSLYLIAEKIENHGNLTAPGGDVELAAGAQVLVSDSADGRSLSAVVQLPQGSVDNFGRVTANAGTIALQAQVVNQNGVLQADSIAEKNGVIELVASEQLHLGSQSQLLARGDATAAGSAGGTVTLRSENNFSDDVGSQVVTTGGVNGGAGGNIEVSAPNIQSLNSAMDASAQPGSVGGEFLLDPVNIVLGTTGSGTVPANGTVAYNTSGTLNLNVNTAFANKNFSQISLQASGNITLNASTTWNLSASTGKTTGLLTLQAGGDIVFGNRAVIFDANNWSVSLAAGYNFINGAVQPNAAKTGNIYLNGGSAATTSGTIQLAAGNINLVAAENILVAPAHSQVVSGSIFTTGGGNIFAEALTGDIIAGTSNGGNGSKQTSDYFFNAAGAVPNAVLGGISTAAGGNVTLIAGNNIDSTPIVPAKQAPGASGTYGAGDVTLIAGNQITGNYNLAAGTGTLLAGATVTTAQAVALQNAAANPSTAATTLSSLVTSVKNSSATSGNIGAAPLAGKPSTAPVTLSVIDGVWDAWAANDISIREVNNPNGTFNVSQSFQYNYSPTAAANFWAGNAIELIGASLTRLSSVNQTPIYAPVLSLNAGAGGILIDKSIILAPSSQGALNIVTRNGGNLSGAVTSGSTVLNGITMSDSGTPNDYTTFAAGHAAVPLHLHDPNPVTLAISGGINSFSLTVPTFANVAVAGNTYNFGFQGRNLSPAQTTSIQVQGAITYRGDFTTLNLTAAQLADLLPASLFTASADNGVTSKLRYDATTGELIFVGVMSASDLAFLLNPTVLVLDKNGNPVMQPVLDENGNLVLDANGIVETTPVTTPLVLDATQQGMIRQLFTASQSASLGDQGLAIAGSGNFNLVANSIDLGVSGGIRVLPPDDALAAISPYGAKLNITTVGDLAMTSTLIANESYLGSINLNVGGTLNVGGQFTTLGDPSAPKGIFTTSSGNVSVLVNGDVNIDGSRIAAYSGGNVNLESLTGNVNAGTGGAGYVSLTAQELDPTTGLLTSIPATIPGSGILATTVTGTHAPLGDILIETPNGNISANQGGIVQLSFNGTDDSKATTELLAGYQLRAANGDSSFGNPLASGTPVPELSAQNKISFGSTISVHPAGTPAAIDLTSVLDVHGNPLTDASGHDLYFKTADTTRQLVTYLNGAFQPYLDLGGYPVIAAQPYDASGNSYLDAHGNPQFVLGRNVDASGSGVIAQNIIAKATGEINGLFVGTSINITTTELGKIITFSPDPPKINDGKDGTPPSLGPDIGPVVISDVSSTAAPSPPVTKNEAPTAETAATVTTKTEDQDSGLFGNGKTKRKDGIALAQKVSRVTVLLPAKN